MKQWIGSIIKQKEFIFLFGLWLLVQIFLIISNGVTTGGEGTRIIREANNLQQTGHFSSPAFYMYFTEIAMVYVLMLKLGLSYFLIVIIQMLFNLVSLVYLYQFMHKFYGSPRLALLGVALLTICLPYQIYNTYLYTESIFFSLIIIFSCIMLSGKPFTGKRIFILILLLFIIMCTRPTGIFVLAATSVYLYFLLSKNMRIVGRTSIFVGMAACGLLLLNFILLKSSSKIPGDFGIDILEPFRYEHIICGVPTKLTEVPLKTIKNSNSVYGFLYFAYNNSEQFCRLALLKTKAFFSLQRSYYSTMHNIFIAAFFYPLYVLIILAIIKYRTKLPSAFIYFGTLILFFWICVICSCDEWHSRFFLTLTPFIILSALYFFKPHKANED